MTMMTLGINDAIDDDAWGVVDDDDEKEEEEYDDKLWIKLIHLVLYIL